jgi:hypothetical protein
MFVIHATAGGSHPLQQLAPICLNLSLRVHLAWLLPVAQSQNVRSGGGGRPCTWPFALLLQRQTLHPFLKPAALMLRRCGRRRQGQRQRQPPQVKQMEQIEEVVEQVEKSEQQTQLQA